MTCIDVFNGDADGICALHQLRLADPRPHARLVTGVKRDIKLLAGLQGVEGAEVTVLDISLDVNRDALLGLLARGNRVIYVDHHFAGEIPSSPLLQAHIDPDPGQCTSLLVDSLLGGTYRAWAIIGAFGDNLDEQARELAAGLGLSDDETVRLREAGVLLNYNGYGISPEDLYFPPDQLYRQVSAHRDPFDFLDCGAVLATLRQGYKSDMDQAEACAPALEGRAGRIFRLPSAPWAHRVSGVFGNALTRRRPDLAHALITANNDGSLRISVRAPLERRYGCDQLCRRFPTGGGRAAAAGINALPPDLLRHFEHDFEEIFSRTG